MTTRNPYPSDVSNDEWAFVAPYLTLLPEDAAQRQYSLREVYNGLRWMVRTGATWRMMPHDLPPWSIVYQHTQRWLAAGSFESMVEDLRLLLNESKAAKASPAPPFSTVAWCNRRPRAAAIQAMMATSGVKAARCMWPSIRWDIC